MARSTPQFTKQLLAALRPVLTLVGSEQDTPTLRAVRDLHLGDVMDRAGRPSGDRERLEQTTVRTYKAAWKRVEELGYLDRPADEDAARELLQLVPEGNRNAFGGALSAGYHLAGLGADVPSRALWAYRPPRSELDLGDYLDAATRCGEGLDRAVGSRRPDRVATAAACWVLCYTGARPRELCQARRRDLEQGPAGARLRLEAKGGERWIPVAPLVLEVLRLPAPDEWLFPGRGGAEHIHPCSVAHALARWGAPSPLRLRRLYASWLIDQGLPITVVSALMGHLSPETTLRHYARPSAKAQLDAAAMLAEALQGGQRSLALDLAPAPMQRARIVAASNARPRMKAPRRAAGGAR